ncbi:hypothetical protein GO988_08795 [Hymenobacter sp. HMF4947]|uniref:Uncharacterized protein n=1 Tax=Hymenobacter ginkgonis TaxID=2682976 RepID=A0A7K1TE34_9BACT|nr:hypothetical protein [Hymenobacter ginkgonis]MVN76421.1 hypothetical protein [Hymenobacter ginkgonis]
MEDYAAKMALKPDAALREYVTGYAQYREAAVLAALDELRRRGQPAPEEAALRPSLEAAVQEQTEAAKVAQLSAPAALERDDANLPELYTPVAIMLFSVMFSVVAGAVLLALNLRQLKRQGAVLKLVLLVVAYLALKTLLFKYLTEHYKISALLLSVLDLPLILTYVLWFWPRYVNTTQFQPRSWLLPLAICGGLMLLLGLAARYAVLHMPGAAQMMQ